MISPSGSDPQEAEAFLAAHPEIEAIDIVLTDLNGVGRGKIIRRHELTALYAQGRHLPGSILGLDITGEDVDETGLVWADGDADRRAWPIPGTLKPMPWTSPPRAQVLLSLYELDGAAMLADPRHALAAQLQALRGLGMGAAAAFEVEFYLLDGEGLPGEAPRPARFALSGRTSHATEVYSVEALDEMSPIFSAVYEGAKALDLPLETLISEYAPAQYELTLHYRDDPLKAADDLIITKRLLRAIARRHGAQACFMAKPFAGKAGSGMHMHLSLTGDGGRNLFADQAAGLSPLMLQTIGGLQVTMADGMAIFAPHGNSWRRFAANSYAPMAPTWGINNRSVALRVTEGSPAARHFEHRVAGIDANPYLVGAMVIAGAIKGVTERLDPGPPVSGNGYEGQAGGAVPTDWRAALAGFEASAFAKSALGDTMHRVFLAVKRAEHARLQSMIPDTDYRLYRDTV